MGAFTAQLRRMALVGAVQDNETRGRPAAMPPMNSLMQSAVPTSAAARLDLTRPNALFQPSQGGPTLRTPPTVAMPQRPPHAVMR